MATRINHPKQRSWPPRRAGKTWSGTDLYRLTVMAERKLPADRIARRLQRSEDAVRAEAIRQRLKLAPTEKRPYGGFEFGSAGAARAAGATGSGGAAGAAGPRGAAGAAGSARAALARSRARSRVPSRGTETLF